MSFFRNLNENETDDKNHKVKIIPTPKQGKLNYILEP